MKLVPKNPSNDQVKNDGDTFVENNLNKFNLQSQGEDRPSPRSTEIQELWKLLKVNLRFLIFCMLAALALFAIIQLFSEHKYKAATRVSISARRPHDTAIDIQNVNEELMDDINSITEYYKSTEAMDQLAQRLSTHKNLYVSSTSGIALIRKKLGVDKPTSTIETLAVTEGKSLTSHLEFNVVPNISGRSISLEVISNNPELSAAAANEFAKLIISWNHKAAVKSIIETRALLQKQEEELKARLKLMESQLTQFQSSNQILASDEAQLMSYRNLEKAKEELKSTEQKIEVNEKTIKDISREIKEVESNATENRLQMARVSLANQLQHKVTLLQYQISTTDDPVKKPKLLKDYKILSEKYQKALKNQGVNSVYSSDPLEYTSSLRESLQKLQEDNKLLTNRRNILSRDLSVLHSNLSKVATVSQKLSELKRNADLTNELYTTLKKKIQELDIKELGVVDNFIITQEAKPPTKTFGPPITLSVVFAMALGLFLGAVLVIIRESLVRVIRNREDLERESVYFLANISTFKKSEKDSLKANGIDIKSNIFRAIRLKLISSFESQLSNKKPRIILVTSPSQGSGKSFFSTNISQALSRAGYKVLLMNLDLRKPEAANLEFKEKREKTIKFNLSEIKRVTGTLSPNLDYMTFDLPQQLDPAEVLEASSIRGLLTDCEPNYDYVIVDTTPVLGIIDPILLASDADLTIVMVKHRKTSLVEFHSTISVIREVAKGPIFGIINLVHQEFTLDKAARGYYSRYYKKKAS